jgi:hypothetical protein
LNGIILNFEFFNRKDGKEAGEIILDWVILNFEFFNRKDGKEAQR